MTTVPVYTDQWIGKPIAWTERVLGLPPGLNAIALLMTTQRGWIRAGWRLFVSDAMNSKAGDLVIAVRGKDIVAIGEMDEADGTTTIRDLGNGDVTTLQDDIAISRVITISF